MKKLNNLIVVVFIVMFSQVSFAGQIEIDRIKRLSNQYDIDGLMALSTVYQGYDLAFLHYHLAGVYHINKDIDLAIKEVDKGIALLESLNNKDVESDILLGYLYSYMVGLDSKNVQILGQKSYQYLAKAEAASKDNPRLLLVKAIIKGHTPASFGGSIDQSLAILNHAISVFESSRYKPSDSEWGHVDTYIWRGIFHKQRGDIKQAHADWHHALKLEPDTTWARQLLSK